MTAALASSGVSGAEAPLGQAGFTGGSTAAAWEGHASSLSAVALCVKGAQAYQFAGFWGESLLNSAEQWAQSKCSVHGAINSRCCRAVGLLTGILLSTSCPITHLILIITVKH